tara:strand:- start:39618 stop:41048 length:1431 start_codon:yes stop_codon:yes gene_type:complete
MAQLLVKEFVDCARALGQATTTNKERFTEFLKKAGYESLNDYKARASEDKQAENFKLWASQLGDNGSVEFLWATDSNDIVDDFTSPATQVKEAVQDMDEEEVTIADLADDVDIKQVSKGEYIIEDNAKVEKFDKLMEVLGNLNAGRENKVYDDALVERVDEACVVSHQNAKVVNRMEKRLQDHLDDESMHKGGAVPSFKLKFAEAPEIQHEAPLHYKFPLVAAAVANRIPTMIVGPAGWGKTSTIKALAEVMKQSWYNGKQDVEYIIQSIGPQTSKADILGYMDANGKYVESQFRKCFADGLIYACDEADAGSAGSLTLLNQGFANEECSFPDNGMVQRHKDFVPLFLANTYGQGANATYVGRNQLDAATLDRFAVVEYDYDEAWEGKICGIEREGNQLKMDAGGKRTHDEWVDYVCRVRGAVDSLAVRHVVSPRASINGIKLLEAGVGFTHVSNMCVWKGMDSATRAKITNEMDN